MSRGAQMHDVGQAAIGPAYFRVLNVPLRRGRAFGPQDQPQSEQVGVVNEALVREYLPDREPLGQRIRIGDEREWLTIVGVVGNERRPQVFQEMSWAEQPAVYRPLDQAPPDSFSVALRGGDAQAGMGHAIEQIITSMDTSVAIGEVAPLRSRLHPISHIRVFVRWYSLPSPRSRFCLRRWACTEYSRNLSRRVRGRSAYEWLWARVVGTSRP